ncbi:MAG TPA: zinc ribbon domain-containing protein [Solirubrobacterales bacterium]|nr:zinc ribbon domain-containing protein [Solirubrobacterales bacterium]
MALAIFGISNSGLNLAVTLFVLMVVVVWLALIVYTYFDARRRISDPFLVACATIGSFFPYIGTAVYAIVRPPEFLEDAHERELEIRAAELRVRQLTESSCPNCEFPIERSYLRCPQCQHRLKDPCQSCGKPVDPRWALCPYCETPITGRPRRQRPTGEKRRRSAGERAATKREERSQGEERPKRRTPPAKREAPAAAQEAPEAETAPAKRPQRSPAREPDADPRKA